MNDSQKFAARVQAVMSLLLIGAVAVVVFALLGVSVYATIKRLQLDQSLTALLNTAINALINMGAIGVGFWLARHRPQGTDTDTDTDTERDSAPTPPPSLPAPAPAQPSPPVQHS